MIGPAVDSLLAFCCDAGAQNVEAQEALADSYYSQGYVRAKRKDFALAFKSYDAAVALFNKITAEHPGNQPPGLRTVYQLVADLSIETKDIPRALASTQHELEIDATALSANPENVSAQRNRGVAYLQMGKAHEALREWKFARENYQQSIGIWRGLKERGMLIPAYAPRYEEAVRAIERCDRASAGR